MICKIWRGICFYVNCGAPLRLLVALTPGRILASLKIIQNHTSFVPEETWHFRGLHLHLQLLSFGSRSLLRILYRNKKRAEPSLNPASFLYSDEQLKFNAYLTTDTPVISIHICVNFSNFQFVRYLIFPVYTI